MSKVYGRVWSTDGQVALILIVHVPRTGNHAQQQWQRGWAAKLPDARRYHFNKGKECRRYINADFIRKVMWSMSISFQYYWKTGPERILVPTSVSGSQFTSTVLTLVTLTQSL